MFDLIQEGDTGPSLAPRTMVYVITNGEAEGSPGTLTERGKSQVTDLARSRIATGVQIVYSDPVGARYETATMLSEEFAAKLEPKDCLMDVSLGRENPKISFKAEILPKIWNDIYHAPKHGESLMDARTRLADCVRGVIGRHRGTSIALVVSTTMALLFFTLVRGGEPTLDDWLEIGHSSCAAYEYSKEGWTLVMPPDNSFLIDASTVREALPPEIKAALGID